MRGFAVLISLLLGVADARAEDLEAAWRGKTVTFLVGGSPGAGFDIYARLLARHIGKHIPGQPNVVVSGMPGAASNTMAGYIANVAPRDGTFIGAPISTQPLAAILEEPGALRYDPTRLNYLGSAAEDVFLCVTRKNGPLKSFADAFTTEAVMGGASETSQTGYMPMLLNNVLGTKFRVVYGYPGTREIMTALDRNEIDGLCSLGWTSLRSQHGRFLSEDRLVLLAQERVKGDAEMDKLGVPRAGDFAKSADARAILDIIYAQEMFGRPYFVAAETPPERVAALRAATMAAWRDPELLADAAKTSLDISPLSSADMQAMLARIYANPDDLKRRAREATRPPR